MTNKDKSKWEMNKFGEKLRSRREEMSFFLRQVAAKIEIDTAMLSKIERGERKAKKGHLVGLSEILKIDYEELHKLWLADQVYELVENEENALDILGVAEDEINYRRKIINGKK